MLSDEEKRELLQHDPSAKRFIRPLLSAHEFLNGEHRWCLWLENIPPAEIRQHPLVLDRISNVRKHRESSTRATTKKLAAYPTRFGEIRQPDTDYILIPRHSSENRRYIPMGFFANDYIASDSCLFVPDATLYHFGILQSTMHMTWVRYTCGRIKSDFRYSNETVYNNFPWPESPTAKQQAEVESAANEVLMTRSKYKGSSLADLYDPIAMPPDLVKAHQRLDRAVDLCYRSQAFPTEAKRIEFLFDLYDKYTSGMFVPVKKQKTKV